ncbi:MAG: hypothetical protein KC457_20965 [Myxococcales bacterium]|nr:hypothetical protein [Myxococcales bacterium]
MRLPAFALFALFATAALTIPGCGDGNVVGGDESEIISRVELHFTPVGGGETLSFAFSDPDGDGGVSGEAQRIELGADTDYRLELRLYNDLVTPAVDIGEEIADEAEEHMFLFATDLGNYSYDDLESDYGADAIGDDLPVGLVHTVAADVAGAGNFRVVLRHLPELNGTPQKAADLPQLFADGDALPGDVDVDVVFELVVQ